MAEKTREREEAGEKGALGRVQGVGSGEKVEEEESPQGSASESEEESLETRGSVKRDVGQADVFATGGRPAAVDEGVVDVFATGGVVSAGGELWEEHTALLGRFRLVRLLARGGMGEVWEAWDAQGEEAVALKRLPLRWHRDDERRKRFLREAQVLSSLEHPHIVRIKEFVEEVPCFTMELLEGETVRERLGREKRLPLEVAIAILRQSCEGLASAHRQGLIHRDLKPENVFLCVPNAHVKLLDFGIVFVEGASGLTQSAGQLGSAYYMAPELLRATGETSPASDVYSCGVLLYECVVGSLPVAGSPGLPEALREVVEHELSSGAGSLLRGEEAHRRGRWESFVLGGEARLTRVVERLGRLYQGAVRLEPSRRCSLTTMLQELEAVEASLAQESRLLRELPTHAPERGVGHDGPAKVSLTNAPSTRRVDAGERDDTAKSADTVRRADTVKRAEEQEGRLRWWHRLFVVFALVLMGGLAFWWVDVYLVVPPPPPPPPPDAGVVRERPEPISRPQPRTQLFQLVVRLEKKADITGLRAIIEGNASSAVKLQAVNALGRLQAHASRVLPVLEAVLPTAEIEVKLAVIKAIAGFGSRARRSLPRLYDLLKGDNLSVKTAAHNAIRRIKNPYSR